MADAPGFFRTFEPHNYMAMRHTPLLTIFVLLCAVIYRPAASHTIDLHGLTVGLDSADRKVYFVFSADSAFEGAPLALDAMKERGCKGSFFFTGRFLREPTHDSIVARIISEGHYVGPHSDGHLLLADWDDSRTPLVTVDSLLTDTHANFRALAQHGVDTAGVVWYLPPYEWAASIHAAAISRLGMTPIAPTPGILTYRDYTTPDMAEYHSSDVIFDQLLDYERVHSLSGAIIIIHLGTHPLRTDKFYRRFPALLDTLISRGYTPSRL